MDSHELQGGSVGLERKKEDGEGARKIRKMGVRNRMGEARVYGKGRIEVRQIKNKGDKKDTRF